MASRAHLSKAVVRVASGAPASGTCEVQVAGTTTDVAAGSLFADALSATTLANPFSFSNGLIEFFMATPQRVKLVITPTGGSVQTFDQVDVPVPPDYVEPVAATKAKSTNYTMAATDGPILASGTITITLPATPTVGQRYTVKNVGTGTVTVQPSSGSIDGASTFVMTVQYSSIDVVNDGTNWFTV